MDDNSFTTLALFGIPLLLFIFYYLFETPLPKRDGSGNIMDPIGGNRLKNAIALLMANIAKYREKKKSTESPSAVIEDFHHPENHPFFNESHYYNGCDKKTGDRIITRISRRGVGGKISYIFLLLDLGDRGIYSIEQDEVPVDFTKNYPYGLGLSFECIEPMKRWRLKFNGKMYNGCIHPIKLKQLKQGNPKKEKVEVSDLEFDLTYTADSPLFWYMRDDSKYTLANNLSQEPWGYYFFKSCIMRTKNHGHYEEYGRLVGDITVSGKPGSKGLKYDFGTFRDHSWDIRRWQTMDKLLILLLAFDEPITIFGTQCYYLDLTLVDMPGNLGGVQRYSTGYLVPKLEKGLSSDAPNQKIFSMTSGTSIKDIPFKTSIDGVREPMDSNEVIMYVAPEPNNENVESVGIKVKMSGNIRRLMYWPDEGAFMVYEDYMKFEIINELTGEKVEGYGTRQSGFRFGEFDPTQGGCG